MFGLNVSSYAIILICILNFLASISFFIYDYLRKRKYYNSLLKKLDELDKKYFIGDVASEGDFLEGKILFEVIEQATKSMKDDISEAVRNSTEYKEYIELWVHEIKTPIATCKLIIENNENEITESIEDEVSKVENYIEQVLFYARSNAVEKDYLIKEINLKDSINSVIRRNANILIEKKIKIDINDVDKLVYCDSKWIEFILNQIISNSIKYMNKKNSELKMYCDKVNEDVTTTESTTSSVSSSSNPNNSNIVYANAGSSSSSKYHKSENSHGMKDALQMTEKEARKEGYTPCSTCFK